MVRATHATEARTLTTPNDNSHFEDENSEVGREKASIREVDREKASIREVAKQDAETSEVGNQDADFDVEDANSEQASKHVEYIDKFWSSTFILVE